MVNEYTGAIQRAGAGTVRQDARRWKPRGCFRGSNNNNLKNQGHQCFGVAAASHATKVAEKEKTGASGGEMGGYSSTPRKGKVSEEEGDDSLFYAVSGMQVSSSFE